MLQRPGGSRGFDPATPSFVPAARSGASLRDSPRSGAGGPPEEISVSFLGPPAAEIPISRSEERDDIIKTWLKNAGVEDEYIEILFNDRTTVSWSRVFTHQSKGHDGFDYELMEIMGDKILNMLLNMFIIDFKSAKTVSKISGMHRVLTSNKTFGIFIEERKLETYLAIDVPITEKIRGDMFEAIVGNIADILRKEINFPTAIYVLDKFVIWNMRKLDSKYFEASKDPVQFLNDLFYQAAKRLPILRRAYPLSEIIIIKKVGDKSNFSFIPPIEIADTVPSFSSELFDFTNNVEEKKKFALKIIAKFRDAGIVKPDSLSVLKLDI